MRLFVKICGIRDVEAGLAAAEAGADALGFVFHRPSRRFVEPEAAGAIGAAVAAALGRAPARVGVFVDAPLEEIRVAARAAGLDYLQLHGGETAAFCREARRLTGCRIIKGLRVGREGRALPAAPWEPADVDLFLLDSDVPGRAGGTGVAFDWGVARRLRLPAPVLLAGGLTPENVDAALEAARPAGVDVSSGVETDGRKDVAKIRAFVARVRGWECERTGTGGDAGPGLPLAR